RDADAGVRADQAALTDLDHFGAAAGERTHDGGTAADVRAVPDDDPGRDATLHHGRSEGTRVEVDETLVHHGRADRQVRAEADPVGVGDPYAGRHHVVEHAGELVHAVHDEPVAGRPLSQADLVNLIGGDRTGRGPRDGREQAEDAVRPGLAGSA